MTEFGKAIAEAYTVDGAAIDMGRGVHDGKLDSDAVVQVPLRMMNRHGLIAGATGTGKTVTLQTLAEQLSAAGGPPLPAAVCACPAARGRHGGPPRNPRRGGPLAGPSLGQPEIGSAISIREKLTVPAERCGV